jgi:acetyl-CoA carboxylase biotin carboxyl carrier protein
MLPSLRVRVYGRGEDKEAMTEILGGFPMSSIQQEDVLLILKLLDESTFDELHLEIGDLKLHVQKHAGGKVAHSAVSPLPAEGGPPPERKKQPSQPGNPVLPAAMPQEPPPGFLAVRAPMLGTFYRTPKPGAPPFAEVGSFVKADDPVCIIEVMKLFNTVRAGVQGRIARICAEQGQLVEYQQTLFLVEKGAV